MTLTKRLKLAQVDGAKQTQNLTWEQVFEEDYGAIITTQTTENYGIEQ